MSFGSWHPVSIWRQRQRQNSSKTPRVRLKKRTEKKLRNVSFGLYTYIRPVKTTIFFFPPICNTNKSENWGGWWLKNNLKRSRYHPIWSISSKVKNTCLFKVYWGKKNKKEVHYFWLTHPTANTLSNHRPAQSLKPARILLVFSRSSGFKDIIYDIRTTHDQTILAEFLVHSRGPFQILRSC